MVGRAKIKLESKEFDELNEVCSQIKTIASKVGTEFRGPVALPTKKLKICTRKTPCGDGSDTYEKWEMRIHKRLIEVGADDRALREIMRIKIPYSVRVEILLG